MQKTWARIDKWLAAHNPEGFASLRPPASDSQVSALEAILTFPLPDALVEFLRHHDGQAPKGPALFGEMTYSSCQAIGTDWIALTQLANDGEFDDLAGKPDEGVASSWWNPGWIPFAANGAGDHLCIDTAPAHRGRFGQIIAFQHDHPRRRLIAPSLGTWLEAAMQQATP